jgi:hypothetical protein
MPHRNIDSRAFISQ